MESSGSRSALTRERTSEEIKRYRCDETNRRLSCSTNQLSKWIWTNRCSTYNNVMMLKWGLIGNRRQSAAKQTEPKEREGRGYCASQSASEPIKETRSGQAAGGVGPGHGSRARRQRSTCNINVENAIKDVEQTKPAYSAGMNSLFIYHLCQYRKKRLQQDINNVQPHWQSINNSSMHAQRGVWVWGMHCGGDYNSKVEHGDNITVNCCCLLFV